MVFNKVVVSAFIKPLPCLIDVGGLRLGMVKELLEKCKKQVEQGILHYICIS